jgi:arylsulfatase A-like enzyme
MPHVPLAVSSRFKGKTGKPYGDVMLELDWSVGQVMDAVKRNGLDDNTLVMFSSDNGPWLIYGDHAGSAEPLREGKQTSFEGGVREPFIARWPGHIPAGRIATARVMSIDVLPTLAALANAELPNNRIDGVNIWPWVSGERTSGEPHDALYLYWGRGLEGVISGRWKLTLPHPTFHAMPANGGQPGQRQPFMMELSLFDLERDPGERLNIASDQKDVVANLMKFVERAREDLGDSLTNREGRNIRPPAVLAPGTPSIPEGATPR